MEKKPKRPRAVILSSTTSEDSTKTVPQEIIGFNTLAVKRKRKNDHGNLGEKRQKVDPDLKEVGETSHEPREADKILDEIPKTLRPSRVYGRRKSKPPPTPQILDVLETEQDSLIGTSLLEVSIGKKEGDSCSGADLSNPGSSEVEKVSSKGSKTDEGSARGDETSSGSSKVDQITPVSSRDDEVCSGSSKVDVVSSAGSIVDQVSFGSPKINVISSRRSKVNKVSSKSSEMVKASSRRSKLDKASLKRSKITKTSSGSSNIDSKASSKSSKDVQVSPEGSNLHQILQFISKVDQVSSENSKNNNPPSGTSIVDKGSSESSKVDLVSSGTSKVNEATSRNSKINEGFSGSSKVDLVSSGSLKFDESSAGSPKNNEASLESSNPENFTSESSRRDPITQDSRPSTSKQLELELYPSRKAKRINKKELEKMKKEEKLLDLKIKKDKKIKIIVEDTPKKEYGIDWKKYIDEGVTEEGARMFFYRNRRSLNISEEEFTQPDKPQQEETPQHKEKRKEMEEPPSCSYIKPKKGKKEPKQNPMVMKTIETYTNDVVDQIQIKIETEEPEKCDKTLTRNQNLIKFFQDEKYTIKMIQRVNFILKSVKEDKIITDTYKLIKSIRENEESEDQKTNVDRKSIQRLLVKLSQYGLIKYRKATLKTTKVEKKIQFICDPNYCDEENIIASILEESKIKLFLHREPESKQEVPQIAPEEVEMIEPPEHLEEKPVYKFNRAMAKKYGYCPKFARCRILHEFLFYLVYENQSEPINLTSNPDVDKVFQSYGGPSAVFENCSQSPIYTREVSWKMFVPPIRRYQDWPLGWIVLSDVILRLPLSILTKCMNVSYEIPLLEEFLSHPIKKHFLVQNIPASIRRGMMVSKKITYWLIDNLRTMCYLGLIQFGPQQFKYKEQLFIFINRRTSLYNTVISEPGYNLISEKEYSRIEYELKSSTDLEQYWYDMWTICVNTPLGHRNTVAGKYIVIETPWTKAELIESLNSRQADEAPELDTGLVPGDQRGAAGFDSCLFAHLKRNWSWLNSIGTISENDNFAKKSKVKTEVKVEPKAKTPVKKGAFGASAPKAPSTIPKYKIKPKEVRKVLRWPVKKKGKGKIEYDEIDKRSLTNMKKLRTDWSELEDHILLLCTAASNYLCPNNRKQMIDQFVLRDVLHKIVPYSNDKTSRAVHRRVRYILKRHNTSKSLQMCLEEIRHCDFTKKKFGALIEKYTTIPSNVLKIAFVELVSFLNQKFSEITTKRAHIEIPDTIEELHKRYTLITHKRNNPDQIYDVSSVYEIECDTVRSVIHSSLCSSKDKTSWAFQLFKIYQQYPENLLRQVITKIRSDQLASVNKTAALRIRSSASAILQSPLKLSVKYQILIQTNQFRYQALLEANAFILNFISWLETPTDKYDITCSNHGTSLIIQNVIEKFQLEPIFEHPEQVIILDPILKTDTTFKRILEKYYEIIKAQNNLIIAEERDSDSDEENVPHVSTESNPEIKNPSRIGFHMMRAELLNRSDKNVVQHMHDYFVVQASKVYIKPNDGMIKDQLELKEKFASVINDIKTKFVVKDVPHASISDDLRQNFSPDLTVVDFEYVEKVKCEIREAKDLGLTLPEIKAIPRPKGVQLTYKHVIESLERVQVVLRVGTSCLRFVHIDFKKPWITHADKILRLEKEKMSKDLLPTKWKGKNVLKSEDREKKDRKIKILVASWVRLDGSLNRRVLDRWLGSIVSTCVESPGILMQALIIKYYLLKATEVTFLVEQLVKIGCVQLIKINKPKVTLFSEVVDYGFEETDILNDPNETLIEPTEDCFYLFASFVGARNYSTNFMD